MTILLICIASFFISFATLIAGFGLGTLLLPAFAFIFPVPVAVATTALVHLLNNGFKFFLFSGQVDYRIFFRFGVIAVFFSFLGAWVLTMLSGISPLFQYQIMSRTFEISIIKILVGLLICIAALMQAWPRFRLSGMKEKYLVMGGALSGFFGGLSGHQGAIRASVLLNTGLGAERYIATSIACSFAVDLARVGAYFFGFMGEYLQSSDLGTVLVTAAVIAAWAGAVCGKYYSTRFTFRFVRSFASCFMMGAGLGLMAGLI